MYPEGLSRKCIGTSLDLGAKKSVQGGKGEIKVNATDLLNTMPLQKF